MLPTNVLEALQTVVQNGYKLGCIPYIWNPKTNTVEKSTIPKRLRLSLLISIYTFINFIFMSFRWIQAYFFFKTPYRKLVMNIFNIITHGIGSAFYLNTYLYGVEVQCFISSLMKTNALFNESFNEDRWFESSHRSGGSIVKRIFLPVYLYSFVQSFIAISQIDNPKYFYSLFNLKNTSKFLLIPFGVFESYMSACLTTKLLFYVVVQMVYVRSTIPCLEVLRNQPIQIFSKYYTQLQLVNRQFHKLTQRIILPLIVGALFAFTSVCFYSTIKLYDEIKLPGILGFPAVSLGVIFVALELYPQSYKIYELSTAIIHDLKGLTVIRIRSSFEFKILNSCRPLKVRAGHFYNIENSTFFLITMYVTVEISINLLLAF